MVITIRVRLNIMKKEQEKEMKIKEGKRLNKRGCASHWRKEKDLWNIKLALNLSRVHIKRNFTPDVP